MPIPTFSNGSFNVLSRSSTDFGSIKLVCAGDSITAGFGLAGYVNGGSPSANTYPAGAYPQVLSGLPYFSGRTSLSNVGVQSITSAQLLSNYSAWIAPYKPAIVGTPSILTVLIGTNDSSGTIANITSLVTAAKADGFKVWVCTLLNRNTGSLNGFQTINNQIIRNDVGADRIIDLNSILNNPLDTLLFQDGLHPTALGATRLADAINLAAFNGASTGPMFSDMAQQASNSVAITGGTATLTTATINNPASASTNFQIKAASGGDYSAQLSFYATAAGSSKQWQLYHRPFSDSTSRNLSFDYYNGASWMFAMFNVFAGASAQGLSIGALGAISGGSGTQIIKGSSSPNGTIVGNMGDMFLNTSGGANTTLWIKESGTNTNTGWVGK